MMELQRSVLDSFALEVKDSMLEAIGRIDDPRLKKIVAELEQWNGEATRSSVGASVYYAWEAHFLQLLMSGVKFEGGVEEKLGYFKSFLWE